MLVCLISDTHADSPGWASQLLGGERRCLTIHSIPLEAGGPCGTLYFSQGCGGEAGCQHHKRPASPPRQYGLPCGHPPCLPPPLFCHPSATGHGKQQRNDLAARQRTHPRNQAVSVAGSAVHDIQQSAAVLK